MTVYYEDDAVTLHHGDCIEAMHSLPDASVDAVVTDPVEGFRCIAIEKGDEYLPLIESRITRRRDPVRHVELTGADPGLFDFLGGEAS